MLGSLPKTLTISDREIPIDSNYRTALLCMEACNDPDLSDAEKKYLLMDLIIGIDKLKTEEYEEALQKIVWFLDCGKEFDGHHEKKAMDWQQDEQMIFAAVNKVAGKETREEKYIHWWTWMGYFSEIGEGLFSTVVSIRVKKNRGEKLTDAEKEFYRKNRKLVDIQKKYSQEEQKEMDELNRMLG